MAHFNEATIKAINPNNEMCVCQFQNRLKVGNFNKSLAQNPSNSTEEIMTKTECKVKGEAINAKKKVIDPKEHISRGLKSSNQCKNYFPWPIRGKMTFKTPSRPVEKYTQLNTGKQNFGGRCSILKSTLNLQCNVKNPNKWCKYINVKVLETNNFHHLKKEI